MHLFHAVFFDFKLQRLAISMSVEVGKSYIPQKKTHRLKKSFKTGQIFAMEGPRQVLVDLT